MQAKEEQRAAKLAALPEHLRLGALNLLRELLRGYYVGVTRNALRAARNRHVIGLLRARYVHVIRFA